MPQTATGGDFISSPPHSNLIHFLNGHFSSQHTSGPADTQAVCDTFKQDKSGVLKVLRPTGGDAYRRVQSLFSHRWLDHTHNVGTPPPGMKNCHALASELSVSVVVPGFVAPTCEKVLQLRNRSNITDSTSRFFLCFRNSGLQRDFFLTLRFPVLSYFAHPA